METKTVTNDLYYVMSDAKEFVYSFIEQDLRD